MIYIITFILSLLFMNCAIKNRPRALSTILHIMAILPPVLLLTFRAEDCGTDTANYTRIYYALFANSLEGYLQATRLEPLFALLMYSLRSLDLSIEYLFLICGLLTVVPIYIGAIILKRTANPLLVMALFYLMFYQYSFNIVRQSISMSLLFLAVAFLIENKKKISLLLGVLAIFFHSVAVIYFIVFFAYLSREKLSLKNLTLNVLLLTAFLFVFHTFFQDKIEYFQNYLESSEKMSMQFSYFAEMLMNFSIVLIVWVKDKVRLKNFFLLISGMGAITIMLSANIPFAFRLANCIDILMLIYIPIALNRFRCKNYTTLYLAFAVFFWWFVFIYNGSGRSYPYILSSPPGIQEITYW